jgi:hypothetical protein
LALSSSKALSEVACSTVDRSPSVAFAEANDDTTGSIALRYAARPSAHFAGSVPVVDALGDADAAELGAVAVGPPGEPEAALAAPVAAAPGEGLQPIRRTITRSGKILPIVASDQEPGAAETRTSGPGATW